MHLKESEEIYGVVAEVFKDDYHLLTKYHYDSPTTFEEASIHTTLYIVKDTPKDCWFYTIEENGILYGFVCKQQNIIWDIGIKKEYREDKLLLERIWVTIFGNNQEKQIIRLYERNHRDINFLMRFMGAKPTEFEQYERKLDYMELIPEGAVKGVQKHVFFVPLSQILLTFQPK